MGLKSQGLQDGGYVGFDLDHKTCSPSDLRRLRPTPLALAVGYSDGSVRAFLSAGPEFTRMTAGRAESESSAPVGDRGARVEGAGAPGDEAGGLRLLARVDLGSGSIRHMQRDPTGMACVLATTWSGALFSVDMLARSATRLLGPRRGPLAGVHSSHRGSPEEGGGTGHGPAYAVRVIGPQPKEAGSRTAGWVQPEPQLLVGHGDGSLAVAGLVVKQQQQPGAEGGWEEKHR